jgi:hypothetical protein
MFNTSIDEARKQRWNEGRARFGFGAFVGDPVKEFDEELLDALNYLDEIRSRRIVTGTGPNLEELAAIGREVYRVAERFRAAVAPPFDCDSVSGELCVNVRRLG